MSQLQEFLAQLETVKTVWQPFIIAIALVGVAVFAAINWRYKGVVEAKTAIIERLTGEVAEYKSKLSGASPDEAKAKIERLEQTLKLAIGSRREPLTNDQSNRLLTAISPMQTRRIQIMFENPFGKELAASIADVFRHAHWDVTLIPGSGFENNMLIGFNIPIANQIIRAFESATPLGPRDEEGFSGGYTIVREYVARVLLRSREMFIPLSHRPGHAQADFGQADGYIAGKKVRFHYFCVDLPHSDGCFVKAYPAETAEAFCDGHVAAFDFFGGVPQSILYDNTRLAVAKIIKGGERLRSQMFAELQSHYLFEDRFESRVT